ncbi:MULTISPECIES: DUF58 domain-containing protein [unclassified Bacillus (in: firmicutes)]|uniref:DUF58 domain-containing protein n=1 Tax=unclassified Bacillus (in: firmicutes) TaxID=185979 RepID=UPI0008E30A31|nr:MULTISPECIES: DUF58 domain-containing protein [unclassified Bacillus (in: firmicutes)]SFJ45326.1 Uncharacterized conserved protein, DUF58 family, contains vWF domain [Bacillus sp. 71mf]SFT03413.1 Uncharacterized conserved protein, DUF58 family, contains vWF domain [Bacillus sp. 103mf]
MNGQRLVSVPLVFQKHIVQLTIPIALLFTFYLPQSLIIYPFLFYYIFSFFIYRYVTYIENHFQIINKKQTTRLFPEENGQLSVMLQNEAKLPLVNGKCFFHINPSLVIQPSNSLDQISKTLFSFPFSQRAHSQQMWDITFKATRRGVFQIEQFECIIGDPFNIIQVHLPIIHKLKTEIIVYPTPKQVAGLQEIQQLVLGSYRTNFSFFHDEMSIVGVKQYERESFRSIHWKASAKMQSLQAKQYEAVKNYSWTICICLASDRGLGWKENIEDLISYATYICQIATEKKIPFELFISILVADGPLHLTLNDGPTHYAKVLEELARISEDSTLLPRDGFLHYMLRKRARSSTLFFLGVPKYHIPHTMQPTYIVHDEGVVEQLEYMATVR